MTKKKDSLRERILEEMTVDYSKILERHLELARQLIRLSEEGHVEILVQDKVTGTESILLYLIGKLYAKEAGLSSSVEVGNQEFLEYLGMPKGSLLPWLKDLRDRNQIRQIKRDRRTYHRIPASLVGTVLKQIHDKLTE